MKESNETLRTTRSFWLMVPLAGALTWAVHEFAHFQTGRWLGYEMWLSLNQAGLVEGEYESVQHKMLVAMAGPFVTYLQAAVALLVIRTRRWSSAYPFLFFAFFTRFLAFGISFSNPNDEARTSLDLGLPMWVLPLIASSILFAMTFLGSRTLRVGWRTNGLLYLAASAIVAAVVFADPVVGRLMQG